jgi:GntR family transcriptional regulator/MocR family aminotransferase
MAVIARLDPDSPTPLYRQLRAALEESISAGHFPDGRLPSSRALAAELGVSRNTVNLAYQELVVEGYVSTQPRSGLVVNAEMRRRAPDRDAVGGREPSARRRPPWDELVIPGPRDPFEGLRLPADWSRYPYPFLSAQIDVEHFPRQALAGALREALRNDHAVASLQDSRGQDDPWLVEQLCTRVLPARGISARPEEVLITNGSQQAFYLLGRTLVRTGTRIAVENPGWADARAILGAAGGEIVPVDVDEGGIVIGSALSHVRLICITPSHQLPTGVTLGIARRRELLEIAAGSNSLIVEDDYDSELRYQGRPTPALKAIDAEERVVYLGSLSKLLAPGLRLGFVVAAPELIDQMRRWRRIMIRHPSGLLQRALAVFIHRGDYQRWLRRHRATMKRKWARIVPAAAEHLPWPVTAPTGGLGLWVVADEDFDSRDLRTRAAAEGVLLEQGQPLFCGPAPATNAFRLGYAAIREERIVEGMAVIGRLARELRRS